MATQILRKRGHTVETAANGSAGLDRLAAVCASNDDFDLVLCDFQMPVRVPAYLEIKVLLRVH
jgi:CheY-like chemotaxis protein